MSSLVQGTPFKPCFHLVLAWLHNLGRPDAVEPCLSSILYLADALRIWRVVFADHASTVGRQIAADPIHAIELEAVADPPGDRIEVFLGEGRIETAFNDYVRHCALRHRQILI